jgi:MFS family permease
MVAAPLGATLSDKFGRKPTMTVGAVIIIVGSAVISSSYITAQIVVGRFILGFGIGTMMVAAPAYVQEVSPPQWRGRIVGKLRRRG